MDALRIIGLFLLTAVLEILGCWLVLVWGKQGWSLACRTGSLYLALGATLALAAFAWLLTLHPTAAGRVYAAYGGIYVAVAIAWLWAVDGVRPDRWDLIGAGLCLVGTLVIYFGPRQAA